MAQKPTTNIQIYSHDGNYKNGKCICISTENAGTSSNKKIIFMAQSNSKYNTNQPFRNYTNMRGIPSHVFEDTIYPVRMAISTYVLMLQILYQNFIFILHSVR